MVVRRLSEVVVVLAAARALAKNEEEEPILIYNRVPKAGSSYLVSVLQALAKQNNFRVVSDETFWDRDSMLRTLKTLKPGDVYSSHQHFVEDLGRPAVWINLVREPLYRDNSIFYYAVDYSHERERATAELERRKGDPECGCAGLEYDSCILQRYEQGCYDYERFHAQRKNGSRTDVRCSPLEEVFVVYDNETHNTPMDLVFNTVVQNYAAVGLTEEMDLSLALFEKILPRWFRGATSLDVAPKKHRATTIDNELTPGTHLNGCISNQARTIMKNLPPFTRFAAQLDFYHKLKQHFWLQLAQNHLIV